MAVFDVGPFLDGVSSLQGKLEDAIAKSRLLLEAIEGSQSKYTEQNGDYPVLRSLKGRLAASQGPNERLSTELVKFKLDLESFLDEIFQSHESVRSIRRDSLLQAKELDSDRDKLWYEKGELAAERKRLELERKELDALRLEVGKMPGEEDTTFNRGERPKGSIERERELEVGEGENNNALCTEAVINKFCDVGCQTVGCWMLENKLSLDMEKGPILQNAECQTEPIGLKRYHNKVEKEGDTSDDFTSPFVDIDKHEQVVQRRHSQLLSLRPQTSCRTASSNTRQRVATAPVSRAKALLLTRQAQALRIHKTLIDEIYQRKQEIHSLKVENTALRKQANEANSELFYTKNQLTVSVADRDELQKKLRRYKEQIQKFEDTLRKQAFGLVHNKKQQRQLEEEIRWSQILAAPLHVPNSSHRGISQEGKSTKGPVCRRHCKTCSSKIPSKGTL
ncbi:paramyosin-like [Montipora capricornis]|uniref:paramyosin-like n=1 Tax=Montipora capricornis TaxID=246305 RepID=UPI0035F10037